MSWHAGTSSAGAPVSEFDRPDASRVPLDGVEGPPTAIAVCAVVIGLMSVVTALVSSAPRPVQWAGWSLGFCAILVGIAYRWITRSRQMVVLYMPNYVVDRAMLVGVLLGFVGIVWNAYHIAQTVIL